VIYRKPGFSGVTISLYSAFMMYSASEAATQAYQARKDGNLSVARERYADAAKLYRELNDVLAYAHAIRHIADIYQQEHNPLPAKPLYEEALEIYRSNLETRLLDLANTVRPYALLMEEQGDTALAMKLWEEARNLYGSLRINEAVFECNRHVAHLQQS
jgi:tetratricopeptide (TPR) repeat protein